VSKSAIYFTKVAAAAGSGNAVLAGHMIGETNDPTFTRFFLSKSDNKWGLIGDLRGDIVYSLIALPSISVIGKTDMYALGRGGTLRIRKANEPEHDLHVPVKDQTYLEGMCITSNCLYVCGGQNQVFRYKNKKWSLIGTGLYTPFNGKTVGPTLFSIAQISEGVLLATGSQGQIIRLDADDRWEKIDSGVHVNLHFLLPDGLGGAWIAGDQGTLLHLAANGKKLNSFSNPKISIENFESLALFQGDLYIAANSKLLVLNSSKELMIVNGPFKRDSEFHCVCASDSYLWATGDQNVYRFAPDGWRHLLCPDNE